MSGRKRTLLADGLLAAVVWLTFYIVVCVRPAHRIRAEYPNGWYALELGMTRQEVERTLCATPGDYGPGDGCVASLGVCTDRGSFPQSGATILEWSAGSEVDPTRGCGIQVAFDGTGRAVWMRHAGREVYPSFVARLRRWLGL